MKKTLYILLAALVALSACRRLDNPDVPVFPAPAAADLKVPIELSIAVPNDGRIATKAMADQPQIKNIVVAVFGGSGYFNEWVPVEEPPATAFATENETIYTLRVKLSLSESRLRLHIIANCPSDLVNNPPITGVSSQDLEDVVMSKIRSKLGDTYGGNNIEDGYWQKIYLPYGIAAEIDPNGNGDNAYLKDDSGNLIPTTMTVNQFKMVSPIPLVRNFARIKVNKLATASDVTISHIGLAYAPAEGTIAPIAPVPYRVDEWGARVSVVDGASESSFTVYPVKADKTYGADLPAEPVRENYSSDEAYNTAHEQWSAQVSSMVNGIHVLGHELKDATTGEDQLLGATTASVYEEHFITNYQNLPLVQPEEHPDWRLLTEAPYNYQGTSPVPLTFAPNPTSKADPDNAGGPQIADTGFQPYTEGMYLYVYERTKPRTFSGTTEKATRLVIRAKKGSEPYKFYALDILDDKGNPEALLRNFTYTVNIASIAVGTGEATAQEAADATGANVSADPRTQDLNEVSDGTSSIIVSYIDTTAVLSGKYFVMYKYVPNITTGVQSNKDVTFQVGYDGTAAGFTEWGKEGGQSTNGPTFAGTPASPAVSIVGGSANPTLYVPNGNGWKEASTPAERNVAWSRIEYTTIGTAGQAFSYNSNGTIRVFAKANLFRDVRVNIIQKKTMQVECAQKYVEAVSGRPEDLIIRIPDDLTRSMFPLEFKIQAADGTVTPRDGDNLPVSSGKSIVPGKETQSAFFFIKTLTKQEYDALPSVDGWKEITCKFKTTKDVSATTIYVSSTYFDHGYDNFLNYDKRYFTPTPSDPGNLSAGEQFTFNFLMDEAHSGAMLWNDAEDITSTSQIIPKVVTVTLSGVEPQTNPDTGALLDGQLVKGEGTGVYYYYVQANDSETVPDDNNGSLHLVATSGDHYSIKLSTSLISPNPALYEDLEVSGNIVKASLDVTGFTNAGGHRISSIGTAANLPVQFRFTYSGSLVPVTFKLDGLVPDDARISGPDASGNYTFTPTGTEKAQVLTLKTAAGTTSPSRLYDLAVSSSTYDQPSPNAFNLARRDGYFYVDTNAGTYGWTSSSVNPDSNQYYSYQSVNEGVNSSIATMQVTVVGYTEFTVYIRSYAESSYDYVVVRNLDDDALTNWYNAYNSSKASTRGNQQSGTAIGNYTAVTFTTADGLTDDNTPHTFYIQYGKDSGVSNDDDRGYVLIPKEYTYKAPDPVVTSISVSPANVNLTIGSTETLTATRQGTLVGELPVVWTSADPNIATVDENGVVTGVALGTTTITATSGGKSASATVNVVRRRITGTASFDGSYFNAGTNQTATIGPIKLDISRIDEAYSDYIEVSKGNSSTFTFTPISSETMEGVTISGITLSFYEGRNRYNPNSISGPFTGGTGNSTTATYNGEETDQPVSTTLTARNNREFDVSVSVTYSYYE